MTKKSCRRGWFTSDASWHRGDYSWLGRPRRCQKWFSSNRQLHQQLGGRWKSRYSPSLTRRKKIRVHTGNSQLKFLGMSNIIDQEECGRWVREMTGKKLTKSCTETNEEGILLSLQFNNKHSSGNEMSKWELRGKNLVPLVIDRVGAYIATYEIVHESL